MPLRFGLWLLIPTLGMSPLHAAEQQGPWRALRGEALRARLTDRDLGDGVHYAYQFHRGGRLTGMNMGKSSQGTWRVSDSSLCYAWQGTKQKEECYEVEQSGQEIRLLLDGVDVASGQLTPLTPSKPHDAVP